jgi:hypothetical protein
MCEYGARGTIKAPRQAGAIIHVEYLRHEVQLHILSGSRKGDPVTVPVQRPVWTLAVLRARQQSVLVVKDYPWNRKPH